MQQYMSERERHLDALAKFLAAVETDDCTAVQHMRGQFYDQQLGASLVDAARFNSVNVVAELLTTPKKDILVYVYDAVMRSAERGHAEVLHLVLQHTDPTRIECYTLALWNALVHNHPQCVDILFDLSNTDDVLRMAHQRGVQPNAAWGAFEQHVATGQKAILTGAVEQSGETRRSKKM